MTESQEKADINTILFTNLQLLGLDVIEMESSYKITFDKNMFNLPNKAGSEAVLYFLFDRLNPTLCKEQFRDCWPVLDRKTELQFRKVCTTCLSSIQKEDVESRLPRINAALLLSPGGVKFIHLLYSFSTYVLMKVMKLEHGWKSQDSIVYPTLQPRTAALGSVMRSVIHDSVVREKNQFFENLYLTVDANRQWKDYTNELVKDFRSLSKLNRDLEHEKRQQVNILAETCVKQSISLPAKRTIKMFDSGQDSSAVSRGQRLEKIKLQWKTLTEFNDRITEAREIFHSIVDSETTSCVLDGTDIGIRVPGLLLRECSKEIQMRNIDNIYHGGALNLVTLVQLWNMSLGMYKEQFKSESLPSVSNEVPRLHTQVQEHQSHLRHIRELRERLKNSTLPKLRDSIIQLQKQLNSQTVSTTSNDKDTNLGLSLTAPTPPIAAVTRTSLKVGETPPGPLAGSVVDVENTPDAVQNVTSKIEMAVRKKTESSEILKQAPALSQLYNSQNRLGNGKNAQSHVPKPQIKKDMLKSAKPQYNTKNSTSKKSTQIGRQERMLVDYAAAHTTVKAHQNQENPGAVVSSSITPRTSKFKAMDMLVDTIVDSVLNSSDSTLISDISVDTCLELDMEAFQTKHLIARSPTKGNTSFENGKSQEGSPAAQHAVDGVSSQDDVPSVSHESVFSWDGKDEDNRCDSHSEFNWSNNASKSDTSFYKGHTLKNGIERNNSSILKSTPVLSVKADLESIPVVKISSKTILLDSVYSLSQKTASKKRSYEHSGENTISESLTIDHQILTSLNTTDDTSVRHFDRNELTHNPQRCHGFSSFANENSTLASSAAIDWKSVSPNVNFESTKALQNSVQHSPVPVAQQGESRKTLQNPAKQSSLLVNNRFDFQNVPDRQPGDGQASWEQIVQQASTGRDSVAEDEESLRERKDSTETEESADFNVLINLAPISAELESLSASDFVTATKYTTVNFHKDQAVTCDNHSAVHVKDHRNIIPKVNSQLDRGSQAVSNVLKPDLIFGNSHNEQRIAQNTTDPSFLGHLKDFEEKLEDLDAKTLPLLVSLDSDDEDVDSEKALSESYIPFKQGLFLDSRSPFKHNLTPSKINSHSLAKNDLRQASVGVIPESAMLSSNSIQKKLDQLRQKVLDILGNSSDESEIIEDQPSPKKKKSKITATNEISQEAETFDDADDDILNTDVLNTDFLVSLED